MKIEIAEALLQKILESSSLDAAEIDNYRRYFQRMAKYKYDDYGQYSPGMRFLERLALWLQQFKDEHKMIAVEFIKNRLVFVSEQEINMLVSSCYPDLIKGILREIVIAKNGFPPYRVTAVAESLTYKTLLRQSLFCGMSDGARTEIFRRSTTTQISHEQIYQTYELSDTRALKMQKKLAEDLKELLGKEPDGKDLTFKTLFLLDDFSASGTSYLRYDEEDKKLKGKIAALYESIFGRKRENKLSEIFDQEENLQVYIIIYLCTEQARRAIESHFDEIERIYRNRPRLLYMHLLMDSVRLSAPEDEQVLKLCEEDLYYDKEALEDKHTEEGGSDIKTGFSSCALPIILHHNTPNNSIPLLWSYETSKKFEGLFPRVPRHIQL